MAVDPTQLEAMGDADLFALIETIRALVEQRQHARQQEAADREQAIRDAIADLDRLIGPDNPAAPAMTSITEVRLYTRQQMQDNAGLGLELAFQGMELLARTVRDIAAAS